MAMAIVQSYLVDNGQDHDFHVIHKLGSTILMVLYVSEFLFPASGEFRTFQQVFMNDVYQFFAGRGTENAFPFLTDIMPMEERFYDGGSC